MLGTKKPCYIYSFRDYWSLRSVNTRALVAIAATRLAKIVEELMNNAFKFSEPGTPVHLKTQVENDRFILVVADQGRGMTAEYIQQIGAYLQFERKLYEQQGSGLRLSIVKRLVELHQGKLTIESIPNKETIIRV